MSLSFAYPWAAWLALVPPVLAAVAFFARPRPAAHGELWYHPAAALMRAMTVKLGHRPQRAPWLWQALWVAGWMALTLAAMGPQTVDQKTLTHSQGVDMVLVVDLSRSMLSLDLSADWRDPRLRVTRLQEVKRVLRQFVTQRLAVSGDRFGLVLFGEKAYVQSPLTLDGQAVLAMLGEAEVGLAGDATAIGDALTLGVKLMKDRAAQGRAKEQVIILLTDGDNTAGSVAPEDAARLVKQYGIRLYAVAVGGRDEVPFPQAGPLGMVQVITAHMPMNINALKRLAEIAGGSLFQAKDAAGLEAIYDHIDKLEKTEVESHTRVTRRSYYQGPLALGLICLAAAFYLYRRRHD